MRALVKNTAIVAACTVLGTAITIATGYVVLMYGPDLSASHFGFPTTR